MGLFGVYSETNQAGNGSKLIAGFKTTQIYLEWVYGNTNYNLFNSLGHVEQTNQSKIGDDCLVQGPWLLLKVLAVVSVYVTGIVGQI